MRAAGRIARTYPIVLAALRPRSLARSQRESASSPPGTGAGSARKLSISAR
jgi:hypothetical protein